MIHAHVAPHRTSGSLIVQRTPNCYWANECQFPVVHTILHHQQCCSTSFHNASAIVSPEIMFGQPSECERINFFHLGFNIVCSLASSPPPPQKNLCLVVHEIHDDVCVCTNRPVATRSTAANTIFINNGARAHLSRRSCAPRRTIPNLHHHHSKCVLASHWGKW